MNKIIKYTILLLVVFIEGNLFSQTLDVNNSKIKRLGKNEYAIKIRINFNGGNRYKIGKKENKDKKKSSLDMVPVRINSGQFSTKGLIVRLVEDNNVKNNYITVIDTLKILKWRSNNLEKSLTSDLTTNEELLNVLLWKENEKTLERFKFSTNGLTVTKSFKKYLRKYGYKSIETDKSIWNEDIPRKKDNNAYIIPPPPPPPTETGNGGIIFIQ